MNPRLPFTLTLVLTTAAGLSRLAAQSNVLPGSGNVGIGTANPQSSLDVRGSIISATPDFVNGLSGSFLQIQLPVGIGNTYSDIGAFSHGGNAWSNLILQRAGGNVGIGTTNPGAKLEVSAVNPVVRIHNTNDISGAFIGDTYGVTQIGRYNSSSAPYGVIGAGQSRSMLGMDSNGRVGTMTNNFYGPVWRNILDDGNGNVGIGTTNPTEKLSIGEGNVAENIRVGQWAFFGQEMHSLTTVLGGNAKAVGNTTVVASTTVDGYRAIRLQYNQGISFHAYEGSVTAGQIVAHERMRITPNGNVGIGETNPQHKLAVNGTIKAKEVIVETTGWSDYVFADNYRLVPLAEVEAHIKTNKHLPGIPSAAQVAEQGVSVGDMQARLLAKVEELTLHLIAQQKTLEALQSQNAAFQVQNAALQARLQRLETP